MVSVGLQLDRTEHLILNEALAYFAVDQRYRADQAQPQHRRHRQAWAAEADRIRHLVDRIVPLRADADRVILLALEALEGDRWFILTAALDVWADEREQAAEDADQLMEAADIARVA
jgi:hypothetical protein